VNAPLVWPSRELENENNVHESNVQDDRLQKNRIHDKDHVEQFFPHVKTFMSKELGVYWRGPIDLIDGSKVEAVITEHATNGAAEYALTLRKAPESLAKTAESLGAKVFPSCRAALILAERKCNATLYRLHKNEA